MMLKTLPLLLLFVVPVKAQMYFGFNFASQPNDELNIATNIEFGNIFDVSGNKFLLGIEVGTNSTFRRNIYDDPYLLYVGGGPVGARDESPNLMDSIGVHEYFAPHVGIHAGYYLFKDLYTGVVVGYAWREYGIYSPYRTEHSRDILGYTYYPKEREDTYAGATVRYSATESMMLNFGYDTFLGVRLGVSFKLITE